MKKLLLTLFSLCAAVLCSSAAENLAASLPFGADYWKGNSAYTETNTSLNGEWTLVNFNNYNNGWTNPPIVKCGRKGNNSTGEIITAKAVSYAINKAVLKIDAILAAENVTSTTLYIADNADFTNATTQTLTLTEGDNTFEIAAPVKNAYYKVAIACTSHTTKNGIVSVSGFELYTTEEVTTDPDPDPDPDPEPDPEPADAIKTLAAWLDAKPAVDTPLEATLTAIYQNGSYLWVTDGEAFALVFGKLDNTYANGDQISGVSGKYADYNGMPEMIPVASTFGAPTAGTAVAAVPVKIADLTTADLARYVRLDNVEITAGASDVSFTASDGENTVVLYNRYPNTLTIPVTTDATVYGFVAIYKETLQVYPILIEDEGQTPVDPDPDPEPSGDTAIFNFTDPAGLNPAQATPGVGQENAVNVTDVTFTAGPVALSFFLPADLQGKSKDPRLYLSNNNVELRTYSGTSMTLTGTDVKLTEITFDVNYDNSFNATATTGTVTAGKPAKWEGEAESVTFNFTDKTKINKMTVAYTTGAGIETVETVATDAVTYYDLQGRRVLRPAAGLYIRVQAGRATKVIL